MVTNKGRVGMGLPDEIDEDDLGIWIRPEKEVKPTDIPSFNEALEANLHEINTNLMDHLYMIDKRIAALKECLALVQPHGTGRIDVKFYLGSKNQVIGRHPAAVVWIGERIGSIAQLRIQGKGPASGRRRRLYLPHRLPKGRLVMFARRKGPFAKTVASVKEILAKLQRLMDGRKLILESIRLFKQSTTLATRNQNVLIDEVDLLLAKRTPLWRAEAELRYTELAERRRDHIILLDEEDARLARKGFQFGTKPARKKG